MTIVLRAAGLFDVFTRDIVRPGCLVVEGSRIIATGPDVPNAARGATEIELPDHFLVPGLVDSHVHLCFDPEQPDCVSHLLAQDDAQLLAGMTRRARLASSRGVTTIRDLGDRNYLARRLAQSGTADLPTIVSSGPPLTSPSGHCHYLGGEVRDTEAAVAAVKRHCAHGVDLIKVMVTGGILTGSSDPGQLQFSAETVEAVVAAAHSQGRRVAAHAHSTQGIRLALHAGVDTIEHCTFASETVFDRDDSLIEELAQSKRWVSPTYVVRPGVEWDPPHFSWRSSIVAGLHEAGVRIAAGTDAGVKQGLRHDSHAWSVVSLVAAGLPAADALVAATLEAARACGVGQRKGHLFPGADADVIAVPGNPLVEPVLLTDPSLVMVRGLVVRTPG
ncbi:amidohydrolase family protein [Streptomyces sp. ALI-76-A]|uniref:metal-dependent hydrolase family protein n=1 Tax=Streptomyces sp. ALI-76-A TaxID=3025736 RepID=UPI00256F120D|nr:amidohydrolase family protein [Streptomyces sp. ALI-76-A]MDL5199805.1 amidohydrolase family protein [Streptomyces sp. ALI-76-A]